MARVLALLVVCFLSVRVGLVGGLGDRPYLFRGYNVFSTFFPGTLLLFYFGFRPRYSLLEFVSLVVPHSLPPSPCVPPRRVRTGKESGPPFQVPHIYIFRPYFSIKTSCCLSAIPPSTASVFWPPLLFVHIPPYRVIFSVAYTPSSHHYFPCLPSIFVVPFSSLCPPVLPSISSYLSLALTFVAHFRLPSLVL